MLAASHGQAERRPGYKKRGRRGNPFLRRPRLAKGVDYQQLSAYITLLGSQVAMAGKITTSARPTSSTNVYGITER